MKIDSYPCAINPYQIRDSAVKHLIEGRELLPQNNNWSVSNMRAGGFKRGSGCDRISDLTRFLLTLAIINASSPRSGECDISQWGHEEDARKNVGQKDADANTQRRTRTESHCLSSLGSDDRERCEPPDGRRLDGWPINL